MSKVLKRPMFKMGGSTSGGITSGLKRTGYAEGEKVTAEDILKSYGPAPRSSNVYDFLIDFGLNIASIPPQGNIISTAAAAARDPFSRFQEGKSKGDQLAYAMRAQAADKAMDVNLKREQMNVQKDIAAMSAGTNNFLKKDNRLGFIIDKTKTYADSGNALQQTHPEGMAEWEAIKNYDVVPVKLSPLEETNDGYRVKFEDFKPEDQFTIFWDPITRTYFVPTFKADGSFDQEATEATTTEGKYGDPENNYMDTNLQKLNSMLENKKSAEIIQSGDETNENILTSMVTENKLEEGMKHPTVDGTRTGEISDEYVLEYAKKNKIVFDLQEYRNKGGRSAGYSYSTKTKLKNTLKNENAPSIFRDTDLKKEKRDKNTAFSWFEKNYEKTNKTMPERHKKYLDEWLEQKQTVVAEAN